MTIASEITRIGVNIQNAYSACNNKGATMPVAQNSANLATCIDSIQTCTPVQKPYNAKVIDYDGTILKEEWLDEGDTFTMPTVPTHSGLVFQEWSGTFQLTNNSITMPAGDVIYGAIYTTSSGLSEFDISLTDSSSLEVTLNMDGTKNWGDGTSDTATSHTYASTGNYTITCNGTVTQNSALGTNYCYKAIRLTGVASISTAFCGSQPLDYITLSTDVTSLSTAFCASSAIKTIILPSSLTTVTSSTFYQIPKLVNMVLPYSLSINNSTMSGSFSSLKNFVIPNSSTNIPLSSSNFNSLERVSYYGSYGVAPTAIFLRKIHSPSATYINAEGCTLLELNSIPSGVTSLGSSAFNNCRGIKITEIPDTITSIGQTAFAYTGIESIKVSKNVSTIPASCFNGCYLCTEYDFSEFTSVPTLSNTNAFGNINSYAVIKVPSSLESSWKTATNWSTYADYIVGV